MATETGLDHTSTTGICLGLLMKKAGPEVESDDTLIYEYEAEITEQHPRIANSRSYVNVKKIESVSGFQLNLDSNTYIHTENTKPICMTGSSDSTSALKDSIQGMYQTSDSQVLDNTHDSDCEVLATTEESQHVMQSKLNNIGELVIAVVDDTSNQHGSENLCTVLTFLDIVTALYQFQKQGYLCDTTLVSATGDEYFLHAGLLAASSRVLARALCKCELGHYTIKVPLNRAAVQFLIRYVYTGEGNLKTHKSLPSEEKTFLEKFLSLRTITKSHGEMLLNILYDFSRNGLFCDTAVTTYDGRCHPVHSYVLAAQMGEQWFEKCHSSYNLVLPNRVNLQISVHFWYTSFSSRTRKRMQKLQGQAKSSCNTDKNHTNKRPGRHKADNTRTCRRIKSKYECHLCEKVFVWERSLQRHLATHGIQKGVGCLWCSLHFDSKEELAEHWKMHKGEKTFTCSWCKRSFDRHQTLQVHIRTHTGYRPYTCDECGKSFRTGSNLKEHLRIHSNERPYTCDVCGKAFYTAKCVRRHMQTHLNKVSIGTVLHNNIGDSMGELYEVTGTDLTDIPLEIHTFHDESGRKIHSCNQCEKVFKRSSDWKEHQASHSDERPYICEICSKAFKLAKHLKGHIQIHFSEAHYQCTVCDKSFTTVSKTKAHERTHSKETAFCCRQCPKLCGTLGALKDHQTQHNEARPYICEHCGKRFKRRHHLRGHRRIHSDEKNFHCSFCNKGFREPSSVRRHERICLLHLRGVSRDNAETLKDIQHFTCDYCGKIFFTKELWKRHSKRHAKDKPYVCPYCSKGLVSASDLKRHLFCHPEHGLQKPYKCNWCEKVFTAPSALKVHERQHTNERPYQCEKCEKAFVSASALRLHMVTAHEHRTWICETCGKGLRSLASLQIHRRIHTGELPYECQWCEKKFRYRESLTIHVRRHTGESPFICITCDKSFVTKGTLRAHEMVHTDEWPYPCDLCDSRFRKDTNLVRHRRNIHNASD